ncbi:hypothetical protein JB92DRAFT_3147580 [Gautieria morchelliformis]|nr:hypothetical protein JB92DRAFT_3147580 [Gautieria morchelliformis]
MALFWQLSGPESHVRRDWRDGKKLGGNASIAEVFFDALCVKYEDGTRGLELILGIELSGASQILIPYHWRDRCKYIGWGPNNAYPGSKFTSLSPIKIETRLRLQTLLDDRQKVSKATKASKRKGDTSKANGRFWNGPPNPSRAAFEHGRCLWRILQNGFDPQLYGLPEASWRTQAVIFSLALNFWSPNGVQLTTRLIDASVTKYATQCTNEVVGTSPTWYFIAKENEGLQNSSGAESVVIQEAWNTQRLHQNEIGPEIQALLDAQPAPLILLIHDYLKVRDLLVSLGSLATHGWAFGVAGLLGFCQHDRHPKQEEYSPASRRRSRSPHGRGSSVSLKREHSPAHRKLRESVFVVDIVDMFKTSTESAVDSNHIRPVDIFNVVTGK